MTWENLSNLAPVMINDTHLDRMPPALDGEVQNSETVGTGPRPSNLPHISANCLDLVNECCSPVSRRYCMQSLTTRGTPPFSPS